MGLRFRAAFPPDRQPAGIRFSFRHRRGVTPLLHTVRHKMNLLVQLTYLSPIIGGLLILGGAPARRTAIIATWIALVSAFILFFAYNRTTGGYQFLAALPLVP